MQRVTSASSTIEAQLRTSQFGNFLLNHVSGTSFSMTVVLSGVLKLGSNFLEAIIIMVISGIYIAAQPRLYRDGLIWMFPPRAHARTAETVDGIGEALRLWLLGQLIERVVIGALSIFAVWIIGVPSPLALGLIAGIGEFMARRHADRHRHPHLLVRAHRHSLCRADRRRGLRRDQSRLHARFAWRANGADAEAGLS